MAVPDPVSVLLVATHPVQYAAPQYRRYHQDPRLDVTVAFCSLRGAEEYLDPDFGVEYAWDVPLLDGYRWVHPPDRSPAARRNGVLQHLNPGLWPLICDGQYDIVVCYGYRAASFWIAAAATKRAGTSLILTTDAHTLEPRDGSRWKAGLKASLLPRVFALADAVLAPSSMTKEFLLGLGLSEDKVFLTPYTVDVDFFAERADAEDRGTVRRRWGVPVDAPVALFCGKLVSRKRPQDLLAAGRQVDGLHLVFAGDGPLRSSLSATADRLGCEDRVRFLGFVNQTELPLAYAAADVLVLPSAHEPFGLVVNEAFACGTPAITSDACGAAGDLIIEGETGFTYRAGETDDLAEQLELIARDPSRRRAMGDRARERIGLWSQPRTVGAFVSACQILRQRRMRA